MFDRAGAAARAQTGTLPGSAKGTTVNLSTSGPSGLEANPMYYKGTEKTQRFEQVRVQ